MRDRMKIQRALGVYLVTDERENDAELLPIIQQAIRGGATAVQLRRKRELGRRFVELGRAIATYTREHDVLFLVNDRVDVALLVDADGVHIGQDDISARDARRLMGDRIIGVSAETIAEARQAEQDGADYLGVGAIYPTQSKPDAGYTGLTGLSEIVASVPLPIVAIGGIQVQNASEPISSGADGIAVVSAIMSASDPEEATRGLRRMVDEAKNSRS